MASTVALATEKQTNRDYVLALLQKEPGKKISGKEICENLGIKANNKNAMMTILKRRHPEIKSIKSQPNFGLYWWAGPLTKEESPKFNAEGYFDPTAGAAINKVDKELEAKKNAPKMGEIWEVKHANGTKDFFYILWANDYQASGFYVDPRKDLTTNMPAFVSRAEIKIGDDVWVGDVSAVTAKPLKYILEKKSVATEQEIAHVKNRLSRILDIRPVVRYEEKEKIVYREKPVEKIVYRDKPVEKIVEKIVEKPVEKKTEVPANCISRTDAVINDLLHQLDIYKDMVDRLLPRVGVNQSA